MQVVSYPSAAEFLDAQRALLERNEVMNSLVVGVALRLLRRPELATSTPYWGAVIDDGEPLLIAGMTPPFRLILAAPAGPPRGAFDLLARSLAAGGWRLPGVIGPKELSTQFAEVWPHIAPVKSEPGMYEGVYELREVRAPRQVAGALRQATMDDFDLVARWNFNFAADVHIPVTREEGTAAARRRLADGEVYLWIDGAPGSPAEPVASAAWGRPTTHGVTVNFVYTPPELRGRGYASACVAALSQLMLDRGHDFCTLFTNMANPTSNHIYQEIGYRRVGYFQEYVFLEEVSHDSG